MPGISRLQPVTRIRGELTPHPSVAESINLFLDQPVDPDTIKLYTSAQAVVDRAEYYGHHFDRQLSAIDRTVLERRLAQRVFSLTEPLGWIETPHGAGRLTFRVRKDDDTYQLATFRRALETIRGLDNSPSGDFLYAEFSRGALAEDIHRRREQVKMAGSLLRTELRHPTAVRRMTATGLHVVTKDLMHSSR